MKKSLHLEAKDMVMFIFRIIWMIAALVIWIIALTQLTAKNAPQEQWWYSGLLCCIPIALPVIRFIIRLTRGGHNAGSSVWDVGFTSSGSFYAYNHGFLWGLIAFVIAIALAVLAGIIVLPIYWIYILVLTIKVFFANFY